MSSPPARPDAADTDAANTHAAAPQTPASNRPLVLITEGSDARPLEWLRERGAQTLQMKY